MVPHNDNMEPAGPHTILYIEDDQANRQLVQFIIARRKDLHLIEADSGTVGLQMAMQHLPKIILLDLNLPDMDGYSVLKQLQSENSTHHIPVIAISGDSTPEDIQHGMQAGLQGYLTKPIQVMDLYGAIDKTLAKKY